MEFEGTEKGMTTDQGEDAVVRFLQRKALMSEGAEGFKDPQTIVTFGLLVALVIGVASNVLTNGIPS
jgi:hypothetical protein